jgi:peptidoglycan/LPS O-acetylase OafA/YrhL
MTTLPPKWAGAIAAAAGVIGWLAISQLAHRSEAWDSDLYFSIFIPAVAIIVGGLGFLAPHRAWRWGFMPFASQAVLAFLQNPSANMLPLGLVVFAVYGAICSVPASLGGALRRWLDQRGTITPSDEETRRRR